MTSSIQPQCVACAHLYRQAEAAACDAFPEGIPQEILRNEYDHRDPYPGDQGIRFELAVVPANVKVTAS